MIPWFLPQSKSPEECIGIVSRPATRRKLLQQLGVSSAKNNVVRVQSGVQTANSGLHIPSPLLLAETLKSSKAQVVFEGGVLIRKVGELHRHHDPLIDQGGAESCA